MIQIILCRKNVAVLVVSDFFDPQSVTPGIFPVRTGTGGLSLASSENDDLRLQHQPGYFNSLLGSSSFLGLDSKLPLYENAFENVKLIAWCRNMIVRGLKANFGCNPYLSTLILKFMR